jgi:hypothetical protein
MGGGASKNKQRGSPARRPPQADQRDVAVDLGAGSQALFPREPARPRVQMVDKSTQVSDGVASTQRTPSTVAGEGADPREAARHEIEIYLAKVAAWEDAELYEARIAELESTGCGPELMRLRTVYAQQAAKAKALAVAEEREHRVELQSTRAMHAAEVSRLCQLLGAEIWQLETLTSQAEGRHQSAIARAGSSHELRVQRMRADADESQRAHAAEMSRYAQSHSEMRERLEAETRQVETEMVAELMRQRQASDAESAELQQVLAEQAARHEEECAALNRQHADEIERLTADNEHNVARVTSAHQAELAHQRGVLTEELETWRRDYAELVVLYEMLDGNKKKLNVRNERLSAESLIGTVPW